MSEEKELNPNIPGDAFQLKLNECHFEPALKAYILNLFSNVESQVNLLSSFVPFSIELEIY